MAEKLFDYASLVSIGRANADALPREVAIAIRAKDDWADDLASAVRGADCCDDGAQLIRNAVFARSPSSEGGK